MTFSKTFPRNSADGSRCWEQIFLTSKEECEAEQIVREVNQYILRQCITDARNMIQEEEIRNSINGMGKHSRTAFASVNGSEHYIIVKQLTSLRGGMDLIELGQVLLDTKIFKGSLSVVNLDGGSSTCLYIKGHPEFSFHSGRQILPILMCVK